MKRVAEIATCFLIGGLLGFGFAATFVLAIAAAIPK